MATRTHRSSILGCLCGICLVFTSSRVAAQSPRPAATEDTQGAAGADSREPEQIEWFVATVDATYRSLDLRRIEYESSADAIGRLIPATASGVAPGLGVGIRLWFVSLMVHGDVTFLNTSNGALDDDMQLWSLDLEAALRFIQGRLQPYILLGAGYSALAGVHDLLDDQRREAEAHGGNARLGAGVDYYLTKELTVGLRGNVDGLLLASRVSFLELAEPERVDTINETRARLREADGSVAGFSYAAGLTFGVHYL
jgi:hypothetical protein